MSIAARPRSYASPTERDSAVSPRRKSTCMAPAGRLNHKGLAGLTRSLLVSSALQPSRQAAPAKRGRIRDGLTAVRPAPASSPFVALVAGAAGSALGPSDRSYRGFRRAPCPSSSRLWVEGPLDRSLAAGLRRRTRDTRMGDSHPARTLACTRLLGLRRLSSCPPSLEARAPDGTGQAPETPLGRSARGP